MIDCIRYSLNVFSIKSYNHLVFVCVNIDEKIRCSQLLQRIEAVNVERTKVFSRLTVLFCTPDRRSGQEMVLLDVDALRNVCEEFTAANSELLSLVQEYNRIAGSNGFDEIKIISRG